MEATGLVAVVFLTLGQTFSEGVHSYNASNYPAATVAFSEVLEKAPPASPYTTMALFWRALAFAKHDKALAAERDLDRLLEGQTDDGTQRDAEQLYKQVTGQAWIGSGLLSPEKAWQTVVERIQARDERYLPRCFTGPMLETIVGGLAREKSWDELSAVAQMTLLRIDVDDGGLKATVMLQGEGDDRLALVAVKKGRFWLFSEQADAPASPEAGLEPRAESGRSQASDQRSLLSIRQMIEAYVIDQGRMPETLDALQVYADGYEDVSVSAGDGKPFMLSAPTRNVELPASPWVFSQTPHEGKRTLLAFGQVHVLAEEEFVKLARQHGVRWSDAPPEELAEQEARELAQWISELGSDVLDTRIAAYNNLKAAGDRARALLEAAQDHEDPEIAFQVKKLLKAP